MNSQPTAPATPRTDADEAKSRAEWLHKHGAPKDWLVFTESEVAALKGELMAVKELSDNRASAIKWAQDELTASKAEIAALRAMLAKCTPLNIEERAYLGTLRDRETAYQATIDALRAEVERLEKLLGTRGTSFEAIELRARVGELEAAINSARSMAYGAPELNMCNYDHEQVQQLNDAMCEVFTILDAARAGKEST